MLTRVWVCGVMVAASALAIEGREGRFEFAADAPWRMDPAPPSAACAAGKCRYGAVPIQLAIHDANHPSLDGVATVIGQPQVLAPPGHDAGSAFSKRRLMRFVSVMVHDYGTNTDQTFTINELHEVEYTIDRWKVQRNLRPGPTVTRSSPGLIPEPHHFVCRRWRGDDCTRDAPVELTSEWHGTLFYQPRGNVGEGAELRLRVEIRVQQRDLTGTIESLPDARLSQELRIHYGEAPLPRFSAGWAYGDLHYHSQGTDNDGESAHAYRGVLQAMAAMGLDFVFATDHASASEQVDDIDLDNLVLVHERRFDTLRDMDELRFLVNLEQINGAGGANAEVISKPRIAWDGRQAVPQLFLGGEVDVVPELPEGEYPLVYGNKLGFDYDSCPIPYVAGLRFQKDGCGSAGWRTLVVSAPDHRWLIKDIQGRAKTTWYGRQHLLSLPTDGTRSDAFVASWTSDYGGATRRLRDFLADDYGAAKNKGVFFLAHPLAGSTGDGYGRMGGPDLIPYSKPQLQEAMASPAFLGLQLWNEDTRLTIDGGTRHAVEQVWTVAPFTGARAIWSEPVTSEPFVRRLEVGPDGRYVPVVEFKKRPKPPGNLHMLHHGARTWDDLLLQGMGSGYAATLPWVPKGQPRRVFMAGGSDAHGDFNYRREGYMLEGISTFTDTAIAKPRNLVFVGAPAGAPIGGAAPYTQAQITSALASGQFSVTDGPALRIAWDVNRNGDIDAADVPMGQQLSFDAVRLMPPLVVEWKSTPEFGPLDHVDLYVGAFSDELGRGVVYTTVNHGVRAPHDPQGKLERWFKDPGSDRTVGLLEDGYAVDAKTTLTMRIVPAAGEEMAGKRSITLDAASYPIPRFLVKCGVALIDADARLPGGCDVTGVLGTVKQPTRLYVRAFAQTRGWHAGSACNARLEECLPRFAFTNPLWAQPFVRVPHHR